MNDFSIERIYKNIRSIAKQKNLKMNELETTAGTYPGYCLGHQKRVANQGYRNGAGRDNPNLEIIWRFSKLLNVSINDLIEREY